MLKSIFGTMALGLFLVAGCAAETDLADEEDIGEDEGEAKTGKQKVSLKYEGTCEFLRVCSSYSKGLSSGQVMWGCTGKGACDDDALWVAGPTKGQCGKKVKLCKGKTCTTALVKDISVSKDWEASNGVMEALGLPYGLSKNDPRTCSGYGGGSVTVEYVN